MKTITYRDALKEALVEEMETGRNRLPYGRRHR